MVTLITNLTSAIIEVAGRTLTVPSYALTLFQNQNDGKRENSGKYVIRGFGVNESDFIFDLTLGCGSDEYTITYDTESYYKWVILTFKDGTIVSLERSDKERELDISTHDKYTVVTHFVMPQKIRDYWCTFGNFPVRTWVPFSELPELPVPTTAP